MTKNIFKSFFHLAVSIIVVFVFSGNDCTTDNNPFSRVEPPRFIKLSINGIPGGESSAAITWVKSLDHDDPDFDGYQVGTYELNSRNEIIAQYQFSSAGLNTSAIITPVPRGKRFRSYISALSKTQRSSDSIATKIYSGVFADSGNILSTSITSSGFGWNKIDGTDSTYSYNFTNSPFIDLMFLAQGSNLNFLSPNQFPPGSKVTRIELLGSGISAYNDTELSEPLQIALPVAVELDNVYLLKTQESFYIKLWVKNISSNGAIQPVYTITFDYKLQSIAGLLVL